MEAVGVAQDVVSAVPAQREPAVTDPVPVAALRTFGPLRRIGLQLNSGQGEW